MVQTPDFEKKDRFIKEDGVTKTPFPIYPHEIRDEPESLGRFGNKKIKSMAQDKKIEDYLHLFLGCEVSVNGRIVDLTAYLLTELENGHWQDTVKPILRPLSSMIEEENGKYHSLLHRVSTKVYTIPLEAEATRYLLSKHFDLFNLHEAGLCLYKTDLK